MRGNRTPLGVLVAALAGLLVVLIVPGVLRADDALDRQTPRRTVEGFLHETMEGDFRAAANYLDLGDIPAEARDSQGPELARELGFVLERQATLEVAKIPDDPDGTPHAKPPGTYVADTLYAGEEPVPILLEREHFPDGIDRWLIAKKTVHLIPVVNAAYGARPIGLRLPGWLTRTMFLGNEAWQWLGALGAILVAYLVGRIVAGALVKAASYLAKRTPTAVDDALVEAGRRPLRMLLAALVYRALLGPLQLTASVVDVSEHATYTLVVLALTWLFLRALNVWTLLLDERAARESFDVLHGRRIRTQAVLLHRVASITVGFLSAAVVLFQFEFVRSVSVSLLASAGVVGVVVGFAAQKSLAAIIGGIQFSVAQPVRIGDQVLVEGEFGEIEEIYLTYIVVRLWDKRRMILPITYFLEKPFQNWTRSTTDLVGTVFIKVGFSMPLGAVRAELKRICAAEPLWDQRTCTVQATDSDASSVTLRALVSAANASSLWDLRCNVREKLLEFVHSYDRGQHLPELRYALQSSGPRAASGSPPPPPPDNSPRG